MIHHNDSQAQQLFNDGQRVTAAVTIQRSAIDLYRAWHRFDQLPRFIDKLIRVEPVGRGVWRWTVEGPGNSLLSWDAAIIADEPGRVVAWKTLRDSEVPNAGSVRFRELSHRRGTEVHATIEYIAPGGTIGAWFAKLAGSDPKSLLHEGLHRFRQVMETGEIATVTGQPAGAGRADKPEHSARDTDWDVRDIARAGGAR